MDLRLDIERRKKYSSKERDHKRDGVRDSDSHGSSRERSSEKFTKYHKKSKYGLVIWFYVLRASSLPNVLSRPSNLQLWGTEFLVMHVILNMYQKTCLNMDLVGAGVLMAIKLYDFLNKFSTQFKQLNTLVWFHYPVVWSS